jgi:hypothetical protein
MAKKLLVARLGAGSITIALCAALPGCNLAAPPSTSDCVGYPSSRGHSFVVCAQDGARPDQTEDVMTAVEVGQTDDAGNAAEASHDSSCDGVTDTGKDQVSGDEL